MSISRRMDRLWNIYIILFKNQKWTIIQHLKQDQVYILYDCIYIKLKNRKNYSSIQNTFEMETECQGGFLWY